MSGPVSTNGRRSWWPGRSLPPSSTGWIDSVAAAMAVAEPSHPDGRLLPAENRVEPLIVDTSIYHVNGAQSSCGPHEDVVVVDHQVGALHELDPHLLGQVQVLVVRGVVDARRQQNDSRVVYASRCKPSEVAEQLVDVALDRTHGVAREEVGQDPLHHVPVGLDVRRARGGAQVVFEDEEVTLFIPDQVDARDVAVDPVRYLEPFALAHVERAA